MYVQFSFKTCTRPQSLVRHILQRIYAESNGYNSVKIIGSGISQTSSCFEYFLSHWSILISTPTLHPVHKQLFNTYPETNLFSVLVSVGKNYGWSEWMSR